MTPPALTQTILACALDCVLRGLFQDPACLAYVHSMLRRPLPPETLPPAGSRPHALARTTIAVGTRVTVRPPHRTVRADFPHTAPTSGV